MKAHKLPTLLAIGLALAPFVHAQDMPQEVAPGVILSPGSAAAREPVIDPEAEKAKATEALDALEEKYLALESYHLKARKVGTMQRTRVEEATTVWKERDEQQRARWRMELEIVRQIENTAPATTKTINVSLHDESWTYTQTGEQRRVMRSLPNQWNSHFDVLRRSMTAHVNLVGLDGEEKIQDQTCTIFKVARGPEQRRTIQRYWISNENGLLLRETQTREGRVDESTYEVESMTVNQPIAESVWNYTPPEGVEVMDLLERQQQLPAQRQRLPTLPDM